VASSDGAAGRRPDLIAAAQAAASWGHARRSAWTSTPLALPAPPEPEAPTAAAPRAVSAAAASTAPAVSPRAEPSPPAQSVRSAPSVAARAQTGARALGSAVAARLPQIGRAAAVLAVLAGTGYGGTYVWRAMSTPSAGVERVAPAGAEAKPAGGLRINSTPAGAQVRVDGKPRGVTPLTLSDLAVGRHTIELVSSAGTVRRTVDVSANAVAEMDEAIFSGFLTVISPFEVTIHEGGRELRLDDRYQVMLPPGRHQLTIANPALGFESVREVQLKPGEATTLTVKPPPSALTVTATESAEVFLDGARIGDAPVNARPVDLGTHEIVVKRLGGAGERKFTVTITARPFTLNVDFSKPAAP